MTEKDQSLKSREWFLTSSVSTSPLKGNYKSEFEAQRKINIIRRLFLETANLYSDLILMQLVCGMVFMACSTFQVDMVFQIG